MPEKNIFDEIVESVMQAVPDNIKALGSDTEKQLKAVVQNALVKMDLVLREEFDAQSKVLARTRTQLNKLEKQIEALEKDLKKHEK